MAEPERHRPCRRLASIAYWLGIVGLLPGAGFPFALAAACCGIAARKRLLQEGHPPEMWFARRAIALGIAGLVITPACAGACWKLLMIQGQYFASLPRSGLRSTAAALESYRSDHGRYPASTFDLSLSARMRSRGIERSAQPGFRIKGDTELATLTTPVSYLTSLYVDPCAGGSRPFGYFSDGTEWILFSAGVDQVQDVDWRGMTFEQVVASGQILLLQYDPTNGIYSGGDIIWKGPPAP